MAFIWKDRLDLSRRGRQQSLPSGSSAAPL